jgi:hypothetical protein
MELQLLLGDRIGSANINTDPVQMSAVRENVSNKDTD